MKRILIAALALFTSALLTAPAASAGKALALSLSPSAQTVTEGGTATLTLGKSGGNGKPTTARITTSDGSFSASILPGSSFSLPTKDDSIVNGTRTITVTATASTGATAKATVTVLDNDVAPPPVVVPPPPVLVWTKCADEIGVCTITGTAQVRYGFGTAWAVKTFTGSIHCDNATFGDPIPGTEKICETTGVVVVIIAPPAPVPTPVPSGSWAAAPLKVGGYAWTASNQPQGCCNGIVSRVIAGPITSSEADPAMRQQMWLLQFYADSTGSFPVGSSSATGLQSWWREKDIQGVAPAP